MKFKVLTCSGLVAVAAIIGAVAACSTIGSDLNVVNSNIAAQLPQAFALGCQGVSIADGAFKAASPALVAAGKLTQDDVTHEASIFGIAQATCANPPTDAASAATILIGDAGAIYLLMAK